MRRKHLSESLRLSLLYFTGPAMGFRRSGVGLRSSSLAHTITLQISIPCMHFSCFTLSAQRLPEQKYLPRRLSLRRNKAFPPGDAVPSCHDGPKASQLSPSPKSTPTRYYSTIHHACIRRTCPDDLLNHVLRILNISFRACNASIGAHLQRLAQSRSPY